MARGVYPKIQRKETKILKDRPPTPSSGGEASVSSTFFFGDRSIFKFERMVAADFRRASSGRPQIPSPNFGRLFPCSRESILRWAIYRTRRMDAYPSCQPHTLGDLPALHHGSIIAKLCNAMGMSPCPAFAAPSRPPAFVGICAWLDLFVRRLIAERLPRFFVQYQHGTILESTT